MPASLDGRSCVVDSELPVVMDLAEQPTLKASPVTTAAEKEEARSDQRVPLAEPNLRPRGFVHE